MWKMKPNLSPELCRSLLVGLTGVMALLSHAPAAAWNATIGANYYNGCWWYGGDPVPHVAFDPNTMNPNLLNPEWSTRRPLYEGNGPFRTDSQALMEQEINLAADHGVSFFNFCWYWINDEKQSTADPTTTNGAMYRFLSAANNDRMKLTLNLCAMPTTTEKWADAIDLLIPIMSHPRYLRVGGKPLMYVYDTNPGAFSLDAYNALNAAAVAAGLGGIRIAGNLSWPDPTPQSPAYDYTYRYALRNPGDGPPLEHPYSDLTAHAESIWWNDTYTEDLRPGQKMMPTIMSGFDGRPVAGYANDWYYTGRTPAAFATHVQNAVNWMNNHPSTTTAEKIAQVYAWNEFAEGGIITPTQGDDPTGAYLDALKSVVVAPKTWTGTTSGNWATAGNWQDGVAPGANQCVEFDANSTGNLATIDNVTAPNNVHVLDSITVANPPNNVTIARGGTLQAIEIGNLGINLSSATKDLTITARIYCGAAADQYHQAWIVGVGRMLSTRQVYGYKYGAAHDPYTTLPIAKSGAGTLVLGSGDGNNNVDLRLHVKTGVVELNKASTSSVHAVAAIAGVDAGSTVKFTGSGDYQVWEGGSIGLTGGTLDLNGHHQTGTTMTVGTAGSTLANTSGTASTYTPTGVTLNADLTANAVGNLTISGPISGAGGITKTGTGRLALTGANTYGGLVMVKAGTLELGLGAQGPVLTGGGSDIQGGKMLFDYTDPGDDPVLTIKNLLTASYGTGSTHFATGKFLSTTADATHGLGWMDDPVAHTVTVAYTLYGDANLDGRVDVSDLAALAANYRKSVNGWASGDFNYDGMVNVLDLAVLAANYRHSLASGIGLESGPFYAAAMAALLDVGMTSAPEPGTLALLIVAGLSLLGYAWRKRDLCATIATT